MALDMTVTPVNWTQNKANAPVFVVILLVTVFVMTLSHTHVRSCKSTENMCRRILKINPSHLKISDEYVRERLLGIQVMGLCVCSVMER